MGQERFLTVPFSGETTYPFEVLLDETSAASPIDFPTSAGKVLIALDIDGTVLTTAGTTPRVLKRIHGLAATDIQVLIASGHAPEGVTPVLDTLESTDGWTLCDNGATLVYVDSGECEVVEERTFVPGPILGEIAAAVPDSMFASASHPDIPLSAPFPNSEIKESDHRIVLMGELTSTPTLKIVVRAAEMDRKEFGRILSPLDVSRTRGVFVGWMSQADIEPLGAARASGPKSLYRRLGLPACGTVAVGDDTNDIAMIEWATSNVVMDGASKEVCTHADHVTAAVDSGGATAVMHVIMRRYEGAGH